jgi:hypothetical protein
MLIPNRRVIWIDRRADADDHDIGRVIARLEAATGKAQ